MEAVTVGVRVPARISADIAHSMIGALWNEIRVICVVSIGLTTGSTARARIDRLVHR